MRVSRLAVAGSFAGIAVASVAFTVLRNAHGDCRSLGRLTGQPENSVTRHECSNTFLVRGTGLEFVVLLGEANHLPDEPVRYDERARVFVGLHDERYDLRGRSLGPPSAGPMWRCPASNVDGVVVIDVQRTADRPAIGRACRAAAQLGQAAPSAVR